MIAQDDTAADPVRERVLWLLDGGHAHMGFNDAVADFPEAEMNERPPNAPYTPWHLLEHIRIAQWDILEFVRDPDHASPDWPDGYWPPRDAEATPGDWAATLEGFRTDLAALREIVADPAVDLSADLPHAPGYTLLREALLVADHNAYHIGELAILRQVMDAWPEGRER